MKRAAFKVEFLTDIVLSANAATEGHHVSLDYIPGANFLGIAAAALYNNSEFPAYAAFHSGEIRFGDAFPLHDGQRALPCPLSWQRPKPGSAKAGLIDENATVVHHKLPDERRKQLDSAGIQLKPVRGGFFLPQNGTELKSLPTRYTMKSAYDAEMRRAKDGKLFGYEALPAGSTWMFEIDADDNMTHAFQRICASIVGEKRLGRSRRTQYGKVLISACEEPLPQEQETMPTESQEWVIYAASRLCVFDRSGQLTTTPEPEALLLPPGSTVDFSKSQIRTFHYAPWNGALGRRDAARCGIEKGSVWVVKVPDGSDPIAWRKAVAGGCGVYRAEGFGRMLLNPAFLDADEQGFTRLQLTEDDRKLAVAEIQTNGGIADAPDQPLISWVTDRSAKRQAQDKLLRRVNNFVANDSKIFSRISASQWGAIRALAVTATNKQDLHDKLFLDNKTENNRQGVARVTEIGGFLMHGKSSKDWNGKLCETMRTAFDQEPKETIRPFAIQVCAEMAKLKRQQGKKERQS
jgi:hypothetical protein